MCEPHFAREATPGHACPRCAAALSMVNHGDYRAETCPDCSGILMTIAELRTMLRLCRQSKPGSKFRPQPVNLDQLTEPVHCPGCARVMEVQPVYGPEQQILDGCARCGMVWLDSVRAPAMV